MKREELLERLKIYKKEIYRRAYILFFAVLLPVIIVFIGVGLQYNIVEYGIWAVIVYFASFILVMSGIIWCFVRMVTKSIPKKIGLLCPKCNAPIIKNNVEEFMKTGVCGFCSEQILKN